MLNSNKPFKAAVLFEQNKPLKVIDLQFPEKLDKGQLLVKLFPQQFVELKLVKSEE